MNSNTRVWKVFKGNKKDTSKARVNCCSALVKFEQTLHLFVVLLWMFFGKQVNIPCGIGSILIHNGANHDTAKNSFQSYFEEFDVLLSRKTTGCNKVKSSCIFYHLCIVVTIFIVATSLSIFWKTRPSLAQNRKQ